MKILHIVQSMNLGGIESMVFSILRADSKNVFILAIEGSREASIKCSPAFAHYSNNIFYANKKRGFRYSVVQRIQHVCQEHAISIIHSHHIGPLIYGSLAKRSMRSIKQVHTQHDIWHLKHFKAWLIEYSILKTQKNIHLIAVSSDIYQELKRWYPRSKINLVRNGIDTNRFKPGNKHDARTILSLPLDATIIATAGRLEEIKGQRDLIQAMATLPTPFYLAIAGSGRLEKVLQQQIEQLCVSTRVRLLGQIDAIELLYQACDIFCLPSLEEGLPLAILEAQACNVPVICSDVGSCAECVDPKSGRLIPPQSPEAIVQACLELKVVVGQPREFVVRQFSLTALLEKYQQIYSE